MSQIKIDGRMLRRFIINGANKLVGNREYVNSLNVFPVPDGDTGTNMSMTAVAAAKAVENIESSDFSQVAQAAANGALKGARGNSGVILSQIYRGIYKAAEGKAAIDINGLAECAIGAKETAYKAVMKPKEGTILTIVRALAEKAADAVLSDDAEIDGVLSEMIEYASEMLEKTTDMLPQLKQAGVVDAGGRGLLYIMEGGLESIGIENGISGIEKTESKAVTTVSEASGDIKYGYCTEFFVRAENNASGNKDELVKFLETIGDSIVAVTADLLIKVHVHTDNPGLALERALKIGALENIKIENMRLQHTDLIGISKPEKYGFVAVAAGDGIEKIFKDFGVDKVVKGGNTMNPSTEEILNAIENVNAETVFVLPNNKNIIMAAEQAAELRESKDVKVISSTSVPKGIGAMVGYIKDNTPEENERSMTENMDAVTGGQITFAVKDTVIDNTNISMGDYLCLSEDRLTAVSKDLDEALDIIAEKMLAENEDSSFVCLYYGEGVSEESAQAAADRLSDKYPDVEFDCQYGGQPLYYYLISVE